jgi:long-chain acyl-CoA synthetase
VSGAPTTIWPLRRAVRVAPGGPAVSFGDVALTYGEMWERCRRLAAALRGLGLEPGDRVAVVARNSHRYLELYQAVPGAGFVLVPLNHRHADAELRYALEDSGARVLFSDRAVADVPACVEHVVDAAAGYEDLVAGASPIREFPDDVSEDDLAGIFYTGGTTGGAKGVMLRHRSLVSNAMHVQAVWPFDPETCFLLAAPMFHLAGTLAVLPCVWHAARQVVMPAFDAAAALDLIEAESVTATQVVPSMLAALCDEQLERPRDVASLRFLTFGGAPSATETLRRAQRAFPGAELMTMYGSTETAPLVTAVRHLERLLDTPHARTCGRPLVGVELRIVDPGDRTPLGVGEVGEVAVRGPNVMRGYWEKPRQTADVLADGWYHTGDLGRIDEHGYVELVDRAKDMIVSGGENVYSTEVEDVLYRHPAVAEAAVFGVPDERWGEAVHAVVVPRSTVTEEELVTFCREAIAGYKVPKRIELRGEPLPKSGAGKVLKRDLRAPYWDGRESMVSGA